MKKGFTLVELIVVVAILSIVTAVVAPSLFSTVRPSALEEGAKELTRVVARARAVAVEQATPAELTITPRDRRFTLRLSASGESGGGGVIPFPSPVAIDDRRHAITIRFDAIARATPETIVLRSGERVALIAIDPWSGHTSVSQR